MQLELTLPLPPSVNKYLGYKVVWIGNRHIPQPYKTKTAKEYESYVKKLVTREIIRQGWSCEDKKDYIEVELTYYLNKKRKDSHNLEKVLFDSLMSAGVYPDDDILLSHTKNIYIDKENPRVEVLLKKSRKKGIFYDDFHLKEFKSLNCDKCKKSTYKKSCGVLNRALENKIDLKEINLKENNCYKKIG